VTRGLFRESPPRELESQLEAIDAILDAQEQWATIDEHEEVCAELFGRHWLGDQSDWAELKRKAMWVQNLVKDVQSESPPRLGRDLFGFQTGLRQLEQYIKAVEEAYERRRPSLTVLPNCSNCLRSGLEANRSRPKRGGLLIAHL